MPVKIFPLNYLKVIYIIFIGLLIFATVIFLYFPNFAKLKQLQAVNKDLVSQIEVLRREVKGLRQQTKQIGKDPYFYEKFARENLGVAKQNEIVIDIEE